MSEFSKELEGEQKRISGENIKISYSDKKLYESFFHEYDMFEKTPAVLAHDAEFVIMQQRTKLKEMGVKMTESISPMPLSEVSGISFPDEKYIRKSLCQPFYRRVNFKDKNGKSLEKKQSIFVEANIISPRSNVIADNEKLYCPNCGKISELKQLEHGCEKCGTSSFITGLFPKIRSFFYKKNNSISMRDIGKTLLISCIIGMLLGVPFGIWGFLENISGRFTKNTMSEAISDAFTAPLDGVMLGIVAAVLILLVRLIRDNIKNSSLVSKTNEARKQISKVITEQEKNFCYEDFEAKVISLLKLVIFCDDREALVCCKLKNPVRKFEIVDSLYLGFAELKKIHTDYNLCTITLDVYMEDVYLKGKKFYLKNDVFQVTVEKKLSDMTDSGFELCNVTCPLCFEHFNAFENSECTFCATEFNPVERDWIITDVKIMAC